MTGKIQILCLMMMFTSVVRADDATDVNGKALVSGAIYSVVNVASGQCLDVTDGGTMNGTLIQQYPCSSNDQNQWFQLGQRSDGNWVFTTIITNGKSTLDFDANTLPRNGTIVQEYRRDGLGVQHMQFTASAGGYQIASSNHPHACLDVPANQLNVERTKLQTWRCTGQPNQAFQFKPLLKVP